MAQARVRRRGGLVPRLLFAFATAFLVVEVGLRFLLGNGGHGLVVRPARTPDVCWELIPGSSASYTGDVVRQARSRIEISSMGTRGPELQGGDRVRVAVLGDGLAFGQGVSNDETLTTHLSAELDRRGHPNEMLSLAVPGLSPAQSVAALSRRVDELTPDVAVLVVSPDDLDRGAEECPHDGVIQRDDRVSSSAAREQLRNLFSTRSYALRAWRLLRDAGWDALLDANGPYGPGREPMGGDERSASVSAAMPPGPWFAATTTPKERWGDVPILLPAASDVPAVVPNRKEEYVFVEAVKRLQTLGEERDIEVVVALVADRSTFERVTKCEACRAPQVLLRGVDVRDVDLSALWLQLLRRPDVYFQRGEGFPTAAGHEELGRALGGEIAGMSFMRQRAP